MNSLPAFLIEPDFTDLSSVLSFSGSGSDEWLAFRKNFKDSMELPDNAVRLWDLRRNLFGIFRDLFRQAGFIADETTDEDLGIYFLPRGEIKIVFPDIVPTPDNDVIAHQFILEFSPKSLYQEKVQAHILCELPVFRFLILSSLALWEQKELNRVEIRPARETNEYLFCPFDRIPAFMKTMEEVRHLIGKERVLEIVKSLCYGS